MKTMRPAKRFSVSSRIHAGAQDEKLPIRASELRHAFDRPRTGEQHVASGDFEKSRHIGRVFGPSVSLPRQPALEAELPRMAYGTNDLDDGPLHRCCRAL